MNRHSVQRQRIGPAVRRMRRSRGLTLDELADEAEVSPSHLSRLERSQTLPSFPVLAKIADALGVDVNEFVRLEHDVAAMDERLSMYAGLLALNDEARHEILELSIEARRDLVDRLEQLANLIPTPPDLQDQAVRAITARREDDPFSAVGPLIERSGIDAVCLQRALLFLDLMFGTRTALIAGTGLLPILPGEDMVGAYRWAFPESPIDPLVAQWWRRSPQEIGRDDSEARPLRAIVSARSLESPIAPRIARSMLSALKMRPESNVAVTQRSVGTVNVLTVTGGYGVLEHLTARRSGHNPNHVALWLCGSNRVGPCEQIINQLWESLPEAERDPQAVLARLTDIAAHSD